MPGACRHWKQLAPNGGLPVQRAHRSKQANAVQLMHLVTIWCAQARGRRSNLHCARFSNCAPLESLERKHSAPNRQLEDASEGCTSLTLLITLPALLGTGSTCSDMLWLIAASLVAAAFTVMIAKLALLPRSLAARAPGPAHSTAGARTPVPPGAARCVRNHRRAAICVLGQRNRTAT